MKLFYVILGATPPGRNIEQHDVFFGIAEKMADLVPAMKNFWPEAKGKIHIDCYREVRSVNGYTVEVVEKNTEAAADVHLYFINLGGYTPGNFTELHEQHLMVGTSLSDVTKRVKQTEFYKKMTFKNATSHIDDKYGVDIDDVYRVEDILHREMKSRYSLRLTPTADDVPEDVVHIGYLKIDKLK